jgi:3-oxoacyl-[acyl-carrier-protein] synthase-3
MAYWVPGAAVRGVACAVPRRRLTVADAGATFGDEEVQSVVKMTGVGERRVADETTCASDLCVAAGERLLEELDWAPDSVEALLFVSQTPDYVLPATACTMQERLGLSHGVAAWDVNLGCSGYVYGLWQAMSMIRAAGMSRVLLAAGDTCTKFCAPGDRSTALLFGDAASMTALEADERGGAHFAVGTDGGGAENLIIPAGGFRKQCSPETLPRQEDAEGILRSEHDLHMQGMEIFNFTIRRVPPMLGDVLDSAGWEPEELTAALFHQANLFIIDHLRKKLRLTREQVPTSIEEFGNTSCASIPLTWTERLGAGEGEEPRRLAMAGFGVGYSWAAAALEAGPCVMPDLVEI